MGSHNAGRIIIAILVLVGLMFFSTAGSINILINKVSFLPKKITIILVLSFLSILIYWFVVRLLKKILDIANYSYCTYDQARQLEYFINKMSYFFMIYFFLINLFLFLNIKNILSPMISFIDYSLYFGVLLLILILNNVSYKKLRGYLDQKIEVFDPFWRTIYIDYNKSYFISTNVLIIIANLLIIYTCGYNLLVFSFLGLPLYIIFIIYIIDSSSNFFYYCRDYINIINKITVLYYIVIILFYNIWMNNIYYDEIQKIKLQQVSNKNIEIENVILTNTIINNEIKKTLDLINKDLIALSKLENQQVKALCKYIYMKTYGNYGSINDKCLVRIVDGTMVPKDIYGRIFRDGIRIILSKETSMKELNLLSQISFLKNNSNLKILKAYKSNENEYIKIKEKILILSSKLKIAKMNNEAKVIPKLLKELTKTIHQYHKNLSNSNRI